MIIDITSLCWALTLLFSAVVVLWANIAMTALLGACASLTRVMCQILQQLVVYETTDFRFMIHTKLK